jgi:hypothetical protein
MSEPASAACLDPTALLHDADRVVGVPGGLLDPADDRAGDVGAGGHHPLGADVDADHVGATGVTA